LTRDTPFIFRTSIYLTSELKDKADLILISHFHKDHVQPEALERISNKHTQIVAPRSCAERIGNRMTCIQPGDELSAGDMNIKVVEAYNTSEGHSSRNVHHKGECAGYLVNLENKLIYFAGDTDCIPEMRTLGKVDLTFLPIGGTFVMDIGEAVDAAALINPGVVIPMHQSKSDPMVFKKELLLKSKTTTIILDVGVTFKLAAHK
jgi:L-ascorbate metabolism protein UlaG (beta-lactamase superfamily)